MAALVAGHRSLGPCERDRQGGGGRRRRAVVGRRLSAAQHLAHQAKRSAASSGHLFWGGSQPQNRAPPELARGVHVKRTVQYTCVQHYARSIAT